MDCLRGSCDIGLCVPAAIKQDFCFPITTFIWLSVVTQLLETSYDVSVFLALLGNIPKKTGYNSY